MSRMPAGNAAAGSAANHAAGSSLLVAGIGELTTHGDGGSLRDAALVVQDGRVVWVGADRGAPAADRRLEVAGRAVVPGFVDSHAHLVFAGDRAGEFAARMAGESYTGGGIRTTVAATRAADDATLRANVARLVAEATRQGTTTVEIKSGYGLTVPDEARSLRIAAEFSTETTFLGAHIVPSPADEPPDAATTGQLTGPGGTITPTYTCGTGSTATTITSSFSSCAPATATTAVLTVAAPTALVNEFVVFNGSLSAAQTNTVPGNYAGTIRITATAN